MGARLATKSINTQVGVFGSYIFTICFAKLSEEIVKTLLLT